MNLQTMIKILEDKSLQSWP